ncbi:MAG: 16S rRNA (uracil(1498)-N(3))-methyltransferase [Armatimonadetes bacterium]|nr:16S rRNA (uracil(1498)-N(3))-methyltransferase [Armatimonadota bacterium]
MTVRRFIVPFRLTKEHLALTDDLAHRLLHVLRMKVGNRVLLCDLQGSEWLAEIVSTEKNFVRLQLLERVSTSQELEVEIKLFQSIPKGEKMDFIVQKATELGVQKIVPMFTKRTVVQLSPERAKSRRERWQKIAAAATEQCGGRIVPEVSVPIPFKQAVNEASAADVWLLFYEATDEPLNEAIKPHRNASSVAIMVGPEGGFEPSEVEMAKQKGAKVVSLGKRILRTETAAIVAVAIVLHELGLLG